MEGLCVFLQYIFESNIDKTRKMRLASVVIAQSKIKCPLAGSRAP